MNARQPENDHLRVAVLSPSAELGGAERALLGFVKMAPGQGLQATVFLPRRGSLCGKLSSLAVPWVVVEQPSALLRQSRRLRAESVALALPMLARAPLYLGSLASAVGRSRPGIIYSNGLKCHVLAVLLRPLLGRPVVWHMRIQGCSRPLGCLADLAADAVVANSEATARSVRRAMRAPGKVRVVYQGVDTEEFSLAGPAAVDDRSGATQFRVGLPGALARLKGHHLLLEVAPRILTEFPATQFFFIGGAIYDTIADQSYEGKLRSAVVQRGMADRVVFTGFQDKMAPWYRGMDVVVNASVEPEGLGRTLLEAMACGRAVVGPDAGGVREFVRHGCNGMLYEMGNARALGDAVVALLRNGDLRRRLGAAGRQTAVRSFGEQAGAADLAKLLRKTAAAHPARRRADALGRAASPLMLAEDDAKATFDVSHEWARTNKLARARTGELDSRWDKMAGAA